MVSSQIHPIQTISQKYLAKLGISNEVIVPNFVNLNKLLQLHVQMIAFGNFNSYLGLNVDLNLDIITEKLLIQGREGYCIEHALLSKAALAELGYEAFNVLCRVYYKAQPTEPPFKTHLVTMVKLNGDLYLYDPGFGGMTPSHVLSVDAKGLTQNTLNEAFRIIPVQDSNLAITAVFDMEYILQVNVLGQWEHIYGFDAELIAPASDIKISNWYVSTSPSSGFTQNLMITIVQPNKRFNLNNNVLNIHELGVGSSKRVIKNIDEFKQVLVSIFKLNLDPCMVDEAFEKVLLK